MKAVLVKKFGLDTPLAVEEVPEPRAGAGEVLVRVRAAGVNPLEISVRNAAHPSAKLLKLPYICGTDIAGEVEAVGEGVKTFAKGDRVWGRAAGGAYAEKAVLAAAETGRLPKAMSFAEGASLAIPLLTAWNALVVKGEAQAGDAVLVQGGAGGVGQMAIQLARRMGCRVFATVSTDEKADLCRQLGAEAVIFYKKEDVAARVMELTGGRGVDIVVETVAAENLPVSAGITCVDGKVIIVGNGTGKGGQGTFQLRDAMGRDARIITLASGYLKPRLPEILRRLDPLLEAGALRPHIGKEMPLGQAEEAQKLLLSGKFLGKIVLKP
ncbi:MAG: NADPH:quinone reductase [Candidatus Tectomicrobia bacterium]|uniref:NADPH:quinone reductase n=1 Tax=Tectimicrobiota bacterium TaxID=2528274 RepID=A0A932HYV1_UNCTE|nr:NADPH:quinone reductase [Candidatus Tectomicrobia bacterium]